MVLGRSIIIIIDVLMTICVIELANANKRVSSVNVK